MHAIVVQISLSYMGISDGVERGGGGVKAAGRARAGSVRIIGKGCSKLRHSLCFSKESEAGRVG